MNATDNLPPRGKRAPLVVGELADLKRVFSWLTRIGVGVKFGSRPIGWYQAHQMAALKIIEHRAYNWGCGGSPRVRCKGSAVQGLSYGKWVTLGYVTELGLKADDASRK